MSAYRTVWKAAMIHTDHQYWRISMSYPDATDEDVRRYERSFRKLPTKVLSNEQKREAFKLLDLENVHSLFDELIQRPSDCVSNGGSSGGGGSTGSDFRKISYSNGSASTVSTNFSKNSASGSGSRGGFDKQVPSVVASSSLVHVDKEVSAN
ncbi:hypothetical protein P8452_26414 [Trifolium repens]|nr:hypothetical protein P8452_26414 [Trifolium repens]